MVLLLVTGARVLSDRPDSILWAKHHLSSAIDALPAGAWVLSGACPHAKDGQKNVDLWAADIAQSRGLTVLEHALDGYLWLNGVRGARWPVPATRELWPFKRNRAEVLRARGALLKGWDVRGLALLCGNAPCRGTKHTAELMEGAGIPVVRVTYAA